MNSPQILQTTLLDSIELHRLQPEKVLGMVVHDTGREAGLPTLASWDEVHVASVHSLRELDNPHRQLSSIKAAKRRAIAEIWQTHQPVARERSGLWQIAYDDNYLFATTHYADNGLNIGDLTREHYLQLFNLLEAHDCRQMLRIWNYVPAINQPDKKGLERYRSFCLGRASAFSEHYTERDKVSMPAATGIGSLSGDITIAVLALRGGLRAEMAAEVHHIENPRQVPAYHYPQRYGPRAPSFARATCLHRDREYQLYISGTSAVRGSETVYSGDTEKQLQETLENIKALISRENLRNHGVAINGLTRDYTLTDLRTVKVYFRHPQDLPMLQSLCAQAFGADSKIAYLLTEICRADLAIEIEGVIHSANTAVDSVVTRTSAEREPTQVNSA